MDFGSSLMSTDIIIAINHLNGQKIDSEAT